MTADCLVPSQVAVLAKASHLGTTPLLRAASGSQRNGSRKFATEVSQP